MVFLEAVVALVEVILTQVAEAAFQEAILLVALLKILLVASSKEVALITEVKVLVQIGQKIILILLAKIDSLPLTEIAVSALEDLAFAQTRNLLKIEALVKNSTQIPVGGIDLSGAEGTISFLRLFYGFIEFS